MHVCPALLRAPLLASLVATLGCETFEDPSTVIDLRVLGISAAPPEIFVDPSAPADLSSEVTALVMDPAGAGRPVSYSVRTCPQLLDAVTAATGQDATLCWAESASGASAAVPALGPPITGQTTGAEPAHEIAVALSAPAAAVDWLFNDKPEDPAFLAPFKEAARLYGVPIVVQLDLAAGVERATAIKRISLTRPFRLADPAVVHTPNQNPVIPGVELYAARDDEGVLYAPVALAPDGSYHLRAGSETWVLPLAATAEPYLARVDGQPSDPAAVVAEETPVAGTVIQRFPQETLRYSFFAMVVSEAAASGLDAGHFEPVTTRSTQTAFRTGERHIESRYVAPASMPSSPRVMVVITVRDERGGQSWTRLQVTLEP